MMFLPCWVTSKSKPLRASLAVKLSKDKTYQPNGKNNFKQVVVLTDSANSSATFIMSRALRQSGQATLVGELPGGNAKGQNGGQMFFETAQYPDQH